MNTLSWNLWLILSKSKYGGEANVAAPCICMCVKSNLLDSRLLVVSFSLSFPLIANANAENKSCCFFFSSSYIYFKHIIKLLIAHLMKRIAHQMFNGETHYILWQGINIACNVFLLLFHQIDCGKNKTTTH